MGKGMCHPETTGKDAASAGVSGPQKSAGVSGTSYNRTSQVRRNLIHVNANILYRFYKLSLFAINH